LLPYKTSARYLNYRVVENIVATTISFSLNIERASILISNLIQLMKLMISYNIIKDIFFFLIEAFKIEDINFTSNLKKRSIHRYQESRSIKSWNANCRF